MRDEEGVGPALLVSHTTVTREAQPVAQYAAQPGANPRVQPTKGAVAMFEVRKPPTECAVDVGDDDCEALPVRAARLLTDRVFEFHQALPPWPAVVTFEVIAEKIKPARVLQIHELRFRGMQPQAGRRRPALCERQCLLRVVCCATQD